MAQWQDRFLGIGELPPQLSIFEIEYFQFSAPDIAAIRKESAGRALLPGL
jgi:hypothetical protein